MSYKTHRPANLVILSIYTVNFNTPANFVLAVLRKAIRNHSENCKTERKLEYFSEIIILTIYRRNILRVLFPQPGAPRTKYIISSSKTKFTPSIIVFPSVL